MADIGNAAYDNEGLSVTVGPVTAPVTANQVAVVQGHLGISRSRGASGDYVALNLEHAVYRFKVPGTLTVNAGDTIYIDITDLTGHTPDSTAYSTSSGANKIALCKAVTGKDSNDIVFGRFIGW